MTSARCSSCSPPAQTSTPTTTIPSITPARRCSAASRPTCAPTGAAPALPLPGAADERALLDPADRSLEIHACHGRARQVEVLRDAVLHLLAEDPTLEPRDVIVMCPDIETFAPLVHATFGAAAPTDDEDEDSPDAAAGRPPDLRVRLADRSLRQTNPVLGVVAELLDLAHARVTASQVLDLAGRDPVRRRFRLDDDDLVRLEEWVTASGVRWGLDADHREPFGLEDLRQGTWDQGVARVLVGVTMTEDDRRLVGDVLPLDDVESGAIDLAGRFAELVDRLAAALGELGAPKGVGAWAAAIAEAADLLTATAGRDAWQRAELGRILDDIVSEAGEGGATLALAEVRALLAERLGGRPTRANFRTGHLTVCTLVPMRSVPHRVVCLLGLDDAIFPRRAPRDGDDRLLDEPRVGERDPRAEDRQLLLDALMAAQERLVITYTGNDERTNAARPPAVPVGELLDVVDRTVRTAGGAPARERVLVRHPLQPFDPRNFTAGELTGERPWSFDRVTLAGARALTGERGELAPFLAAPLARVRVAGRRARGPGPLRPAPGPRVPARAARAEPRRLHHGRRRRASRRPRRPRAVGRRPAAARRAAGRLRHALGLPGRDRSRPPAAGQARSARHQEAAADGRGHRRRGRGGECARPGRVGRRARDARRRAHPERHCRRGAGRRARRDDLLARRRQAPARRLGPAARTDRIGARRLVARGHNRPAA